MSEGVRAMTADDEAFIRAIVDRPGDDLPRLVYADWLDERDDPRGPYLRAEAKWAKHWRSGVINDLEYHDDSFDWTNVELLRTLSEHLHPEWVARITRPPLGVCCELLRLSLADVGVRERVSHLETQVGAGLPVQLKALLLNYCESKIVVNWPMVDEGRDVSECSIHSFFGLDRMQVVQLTSEGASACGTDRAWAFGRCHRDVDIPLILASGLRTGSVVIESHEYELADALPEIPTYRELAASLAEVLNILCLPNCIAF